MKTSFPKQAKIFILIAILFSAAAFVIFYNDTKSGNIIIKGIEYKKTSVQVIVPAGTQAVAAMTDDSSWSEYYSGDYEYYKGVFIKNRTVTLSPFVMGRYEVTQELYQAVMGINPSYYDDSSGNEVDAGETQELRPVETVSWYDAVAFCNELTEKLDIKDANGDIDYAYYTDNNTFTSAYTVDDAINKTTPYMKPIGSSRGYRLPTEAEWEFAARGGDASKAEWKYAYAGVQTQKQPAKFTGSPYNDDELEFYGWYDNNSASKTHEVGLKKPNSLNLYDMSGNVYEWCWDWYNANVTQNDSAYEVSGVVTNPAGPSSGFSRVWRGGDCRDDAYSCAVSHRVYNDPADAYNLLGFRVCRSL